MFSDGNPVSKEMEVLAFPETRWKNKPFGFAAVGNLQHEDLPKGPCVKKC